MFASLPSDYRDETCVVLSTTAANCCETKLLCLLLWQCHRKLLTGGFRPRRLLLSETKARMVPWRCTTAPAILLPFRDLASGTYLEQELIVPARPRTTSQRTWLAKRQMLGGATVHAWKNPKCPSTPRTSATGGSPPRPSPKSPSRTAAVWFRRLANAVWRQDAVKCLHRHFRGHLTCCA
jgi:hypothetical protein